MKLHSLSTPLRLLLTALLVLAAAIYLSRIAHESFWGWLLTTTFIGSMLHGWRYSHE